MDSSEQLVYEYLVHIGFEDIRYEPDGKVPPDFAVDNRIAVEVRRLNQSDKSQSSYQGLEEVAFPLAALIRKALESFGPPTGGTSWFVMYYFRRPLPPWKTLGKALLLALADFRDQSTHRPTRLHVTDNLELRLIQASSLHSSFYVLGGSSDHDAGGFVVAELERNLRICIAEKTTKVESVRLKYPVWWLVFVDYIGYGMLNEADREQLREIARIDHDWNKIILVNPTRPSDAFEL